MINEKTHQKIKAALSLNRNSLSMIARDLGVSPSTVTIVSQGYRRSQRIEQAIAHAIHVDPRDLWPERYQ